MAEGQDGKIVIRREDLKEAAEAKREGGLGDLAKGKRRLLVIAGAAVAGLVVVVLIGVAVLDANPNRRSWRELRAALMTLPDDPRPGHVEVALRLLQEIDLSNVTGGDLVEAYRLSVEILEYAQDYPGFLEECAGAFKAGATLDIPEAWRILTIGEQVQSLKELLEELEEKYEREP